MADTAKLEITSKEQVAYNLMVLISRSESERSEDKWLKPDPRTYFLKLFNQCIRAAEAGGEMPWIVNNE